VRSTGSLHGERMTEDELPDDTDELLALMRREGLPVSHSLFATIHHRSKERPDGWSEEELDEASDDLHDADVKRWKFELAEHFAKKSGG
jgi:hypothetical protein